MDIVDAPGQEILLALSSVYMGKMSLLPLAGMHIEKFSCNEQHYHPPAYVQSDEAPSCCGIHKGKVPLPGSKMKMYEGRPT